MRLLTFLCAISLLALCLASCGGNRPTGPVYLSHGEIPVYSKPMNVAGRWDPESRAIYLDDRAHGWTLAHEIAHASDTTGLSYEAICQMVGEVPIARQMAILRLVRAEAKRLGGPRAGWRALYNLCGPQAVYHLDILANVRELEALAKR